MTIYVKTILNLDQQFRRIHCFLLFQALVASLLSPTEPFQPFLREYYEKHVCAITRGIWKVLSMAS